MHNEKRFFIYQRTHYAAGSTIMIDHFNLGGYETFEDAEYMFKKLSAKKEYLDHKKDFSADDGYDRQIRVSIELHEESSSGFTIVKVPPKIYPTW